MESSCKEGRDLYTGERFIYISTASYLSNSGLHGLFLVHLAGGGVTGGEESADNGGSAGKSEGQGGSSVDGWAQAWMETI